MRSHSSVTLALSSLALLCSVAPAQQTIISPLVATNTEGVRNNLAPWLQANQRRYVQIHSDIGGSPKIITKLGFRRDGPLASNGTGTRTVDLEMFMGHSVDWDKARFQMSSNYIGPRTNVVARKMVTLGPLVGMGTPPPCEITVALDTPFVYTGAISFAWEAVVYGNTLNGTFPLTLDADSGSTTLATPSGTGQGCVASGQTSPMIQMIQASDVAGGFSFGGFVDRAPVNAPTLLSIGTTNPNQAVPGLCGPLYTNLVIVLPIGTTDAAGFLGMTSGTIKVAGGSFAFAAPNTLQGATIHTQVHSVDLASTRPIPIANSDGQTFTVPFTDPSKPVKVTRLYNNEGGTTVDLSVFFNTSSIGFGLVTEFTY